MSVENHLAELRQARGLSAGELAAKAGITRQTIYAIEANTYVPNTAVALRLARLLGAAVEDLFHLPGESSTPSRAMELDLLSEDDAVQDGQPVDLHTKSWYVKDRGAVKIVLDTKQPNNQTGQMTIEAAPDSTSK